MAEAMMTLDRLDELLRYVLDELVKNDGGAPAGETLKAVAARAGLKPIELELDKTGVPRWETNVRFYTTTCVKAGFLQMSRGF